MDKISVIIAFLFGFILSFGALSYLNTEQLPKDSDDQKIANLNRLDDRINFCKSQGYEEASLVTQYLSTPPFKWEEVEQTNMGYGAYTGRTYAVARWMPTEILCKRTPAKETKQYSYDDYLKWMVRIGIYGR